MTCCFSSSAPEFPPQLKEISSPPAQLFCRGDKDLLRWEPKIAVIGTRNPTPYGISLAREIAGDLAKAQVCVVSGLALGIDAVAHEAALEAGGKTIAVLGSDIGNITPARNRGLGARIIEHGLVVSEYGNGLKTQSWHFAARNRLISGLARAVVIIEAAERSGTLITAQWALDQGREVFALPGPVNARQSAGTLQLIREGARLIRSGEDILGDLGLRSVGQLPFSEVNAYNHSGKQDPLLKYFVKGPVHMDELLEKSGMEPAALSQSLLGLELEGQIQQLPGQRFVRSY